MSSHAPLRLPNARVELVGDVPSLVWDSLGDLRDDRLHLDPGAPSVRVRIESTPSGWNLTSDHRSVTETSIGPSTADLLDTVVGRLNRLAFDVDPDRLHLHAALVEVDGTGILLGGRSGSGKSTVLLELLRSGARYGGDESVTVQPGSRTLYSYPKPVTLKEGSRAWAASVDGHPSAGMAVAANGRGHLRAGSLADVVPFATAGVVAVVKHVDGSSIDLRPIDPATAAVALLSDALDAARLGPAALEVVGPVVAGASCWEIEYGDAGDLADVLTELRPAVRRQLSVPRHRVAGARPAGLDPSPRLRDTSGDVSVRTVMFDSSTATSDGATATMAVLDADGRRDRTSGADLSVIGFGLPGSSVDVADASAVTADVVDRLVAGRCTGVGMVQAVRGRQIDERALSELGERHVGGQMTSAVLERELPRIVDVLGIVGCDPVLLKGPVSAHDGPLPAYMRDFGDLDLLIDPTQMDAAVRALTAAGFERCFPQVSPDFDRRFAKSVTMRSSFAVTDEVDQPSIGTFELDLHRTLAPGPFGVRVRLDELDSRAVPVEVGGRWYRSLHPEHRFLHACLHVSLGSRDPRLHSVRDLVLLAPTVPDACRRVWDLARRWRVVAAVGRGIEIADAAFPGSLPSELVALAAGERLGLVDRAMVASYHRGRWSYALPTAAMLVTLPSWRDRRDLGLAHLRRRASGEPLDVGTMSSVAGDR